jgi:hypothetical protein
MAHRRRRAKPGTNLAGDAAIRSHAYKRLDRMTLMGLIVPKLVSLANPPITRPYRLESGPATYQAGTGSRADGTQAAHNLPADLKLNDRSIWAYVRDGNALDANARVALQIEYSSAATVTVPRLANHLDSQWEKNGLIEIWLDYVRRTLDNADGMGSGAPVPMGLVTAAVLFLQRCADTLEVTIGRIETSDVFKANQDELNSIFDMYGDAVERYRPAARLESMWRIYARPAYR